MSIYIDECNSEMNDGEVGFLVSRLNTSRGSSSEYYSLQARPAHTNMSHEPKLDAWCGETNNISTTAEGLAQVVKTFKNGRQRLRTIPSGSEEERSALKALGYPDLQDED